MVELNAVICFITLNISFPPVAHFMHWPQLDQHNRYNLLSYGWQMEISADLREYSINETGPTSREKEERPRSRTLRD